jgi:hypothetical protein
MEDLIARAQRSGELIEVPPRTIAVVLSAVIDGLSIYGLLYPERFGKAELIEFFDKALAAFRPSASDSGPLEPVGGAGGMRSRDGARARK